MVRRIGLTLTVMLVLLLTVACAGAGETEDVSVEPVAVDTPTVEPVDEPTSESTEAATTENEADAGEEVTYVIDPAASTVSWYGSKPIGASETGTVQVAEGELSFTGDQFADGAVVIDMQTIETTSQEGGMAQRLVGHLMSDDFFGVETYPSAQLEIQSVEPTDVENQYLVKADLTIKETTKPIEFITDVDVADDTLSATADIVVDRAEFDVRYGSGSFFSDLGDDLISDEMEISVSLVARQGS